MRYASALLVAGQTTGVEEKLQAAEAALQGAEPDDKTRDLIGQIAAARATLALTQYQPETIIAQSRRALEYLHPDNLPFRFTAIWTLGFAYHLQGDRAAAGQAYTEAISISQASGNIHHHHIGYNRPGPDTGIGKPALSGGRDLPARPATVWRSSACRMPAKRILAWPASATNGTTWMPPSSTGNRACNWRGSMISVIDRFIICEVFLARLKLAQGDVAGAAAMLAQTEQSVRQHNFVHRMPEIAAAQVLVLLHQGNLAAAAHLAQTHELPLSQARVLLAQGDPSAALAVLEPLRQQMEAKGWQDERLKVMVLQAVALHAHGEKDKAVQLLGDALALAEPGGFIRIFVDEGAADGSTIVRSGCSWDYAGLYQLSCWLHLKLRSGRPKTNLIYPLPICPAPESSH